MNCVVVAFCPGKAENEETLNYGHIQRRSFYGKGHDTITTYKCMYCISDKGRQRAVRVDQLLECSLTSQERKQIETEKMNWTVDIFGKKTSKSGQVNHVN